MKLFIYEYFASGTEENQGDLKQAGWAMLKAVLEDFAGIDGLQLLTLLDSSLREELAPDAFGQKLEIRWREEKKDGFKQYAETLLSCEGVLIIAPETSGLLAELTAMAERLGKTVLGSGAQTLRFACNKANILKLMQEKGLPVPKSEVLTKTLLDKTRILESFSFPMVIKPVYGTGGEGVWLAKTEKELDKVLERLEGWKGDQFLLQEFIGGQAVSVSCFVLGGRALPLSLNKQRISLQDELLFQGITVPFLHPQAQDILRKAVRACEAVEGLKGFVGVDLVVNSQGPVLMEINPRLTLAYVALRKVVARNLAKDLLALCLEQRLPAQPELQGVYAFNLQANRRVE